MKLERRPTIFRALHLRPFCLEAAQSFRFFGGTLIVLVSFLPRTMTIFIPSIHPATLVANHYFATHVNLARLRHQKQALAKLVPEGGRQVSLWKEPFALPPGDVTESSPLGDVINLKNFLFRQSAIRLYVREHED